MGKKTADKTRPRPIIVCCGSFKDKEYILHNSKKLKGSPYTISEDFSKATLDIRQKLVQKGKEAKEKLPEVQSFVIKYRRLVLTYLNSTNNKYFKWSFSLRDTEGSPRWFKAPSRFSNHYNAPPTYNRADGYRDSA